MSIDASLFREEAVEHRRSREVEGRVIRIAASWTRWSYWVVVWAVAAGLLYAALGTVNEYATGPAVIRLDSRTEVTAPVRATVAEVLVGPGQRIHKGDELVRFYLEEEEAELERVEKAEKELLVRTLIDPADQAARNDLGLLQAQREMAIAHIAHRSMVAPRDGVINDVRARAGQSVEAGDGLVSIAGQAARGRVLALVPAHFRPMLEAGMPLRLELVGFRFAYHEFVVETVGDEAIGPAEAKRFLGPDNADTVFIDGPVIIVQTTLPGPEFVARGETYQYYDGMVGTADVRVRTESIAEAIVPGLRDMLRRAVDKPN